MRSLSVPALAFVLAGCGDTGSAIVTFHAAAAGPADAVTGQPLTFTNALGYEVTLTRAHLHIGALYLNRSVPTSGSQAQACVLPGIYSGQVTRPVDLDALSPVPQPFPADGEGTADPLRTGQVWLFGTDPFAPIDLTPLVEVAGTATQGATVITFSGRITISENRAVAVSNPALPGTNPLCKQRIVTPIEVDFTLGQGGTLLLRVDPRIWLRNVDFAQIPTDPADPSRRRFLDRTEGQPDVSFYSGVRSTAPYTFNWQSP